MAFQSNKAPGHDKVRMSTIKDALPCILPVVTDIINCSLQTSVFPSAWKISEVTPLLKEGDHEVANNNGPLSLLPAISKICEQVALNQLTSYMNEKKCLSKHQSGNKKLHSCETLGVFMTDKMFKVMDSKELTVIVLLDFSKAFDSIDHRKLLTKLKALGLSLGALEWFKSYLTEKTQQVKIGSVVSEPGLITHGVPQGSILGPTLFNIYLNDLPTIPNFSDLESYVDDSKLYLSFPIKYVSEVMWNINEDLSKITAWCCHNSLLINPDKTKVLVLGTPQMLQRCECYKTINRLNGLDPQELFIFADKFRQLRSNHCFKLKTRSAKLNSYKYSFFIRIINLWNNLPKEIAEADNLGTFKKYLKKHVF